MPDWIPLAAIAGVVVLCACALYTRLARLRHEVNLAWSGIDALLKQRYYHVAAVIDICKRHMPHEVQVLGEMTRLRDQAEAARINGDVRSLGEREQALAAALSGVAIQAEAYPELQAAETFKHAMTCLSESHKALPDRRERYNEAVARHNHRCRQFPTILFAGLFGFPARAPFEIGAAERKKRHDL